jgi:phosphatidylglycerophosphate synthase
VSTTAATDLQESKAILGKSEPGRVGPERPGRHAPARNDAPDNRVLKVDSRSMPSSDAVRHDELRRARSYPISRWYVRPAADRLARVLTPTAVRPSHLTICGLIAAACGAAVLIRWPEAAPLAAAPVLTAWFFDRADGQLARRQGTASAFGAWLDGNVDELADIGLHAAVAAAAAALSQSTLPWVLWAAFLAGKYLLMYGLAEEREQWTVGRGQRAEGSEETAIALQDGGVNCALPTTYCLLPTAHCSPLPRLCRTIWHLPGNADVRLHLLLIALVSGWLTAELAVVAVYYNLRWTVRYVLVARRLGGAA